ncbi:DUF4760 domain-containing protein [Ponticoccus litoralis]|uniref:Uncharacterized protein n=1 Tax=Ponticoccus litoralis TaxID=422297 RepID=A0AAW9SKA7_9RHOB
MRSLNFWKSLSTIAANVTVIVSLVIAVYSYRYQIDQSKREVAMEMASGMDSGEMFAAQRNISIELTKLKLGRFDMAIERSAIAGIVANMVEVSDDPAGMQQDIIAIISFFDEVAICVQSGLCDADVVAGTIGESATRYACLLLPYTREISKELLLDDLGSYLDDLIKYEENC